ncbi:MAG: HAMP domain-containing protein [Rubrivivax sp.]|nr:HAMP domain-containing protein [Rubrivivax sp.]
MSSAAGGPAASSRRRGWHQWRQWCDRHHWHRAQHRLRHSVKGRLVLLFVLIGVCTAVVFLYGTQRALQGGWQAFARPLLADYVDRLAAEVGSPPSEARARALAERLPIRVRIEGPAVRFDTHPEEAERDRSRDEARRDWRRWSNGERTFDAEGWGLTRTTADGHRVLFSLARPAESWRARGIGWITLGTLLVLTLLAYAAVRRLLRPLEDITVAVERFGRGQFGQPIAVRRQDELGDLATRINHMASSLHGMLEAKRALLLAISHELRSPLTRARLNAELLGESPERQALLRDLGEMRELIVGLLESERLGEGHAALQREPTDLAALARDLQATAFADFDLDLELDASLGAVEVDPMRVRLLLRNLVENARRHGGEGGAGGDAGGATLFLRREAGAAGPAWALGVRDRGPGVDEAHLGRLGEAFYRPDSARTRSAGGVGLGLHLCRLIALAHGGELRLRNARPGLEVAMVWVPSVHTAP